MTAYPAWWPSSGLWRHGDFLKLWSAQAVSAFGSRISRTALPMVALLTIGAEPWQIGLLAALAVAPGVLVGLLMGGWIDRSRKRPLLIGSDLIRASLLFTVPLAAWFDLLSMAQLYIVAGGVGAATTLFAITDNTYLPALIGKRDLTEGNARLEATDAIAEVGGPSLAGVLVEWLTAPVAILADAFSYLISAALLMRIRVQEDLPEPSGDSNTPWTDLHAGFRACLGHPLVRPLFAVAALEAFFGGFFFGVYIVFVLEVLELSPATYGVLVGLGGIGALLGALAARRAATWLGLGKAMVVLLLIGQAAALLIPLADGPEWRVLGFLAVHQIVGDAMVVAYLIHAMSLRQTVLEQASLGRANASFHVTEGLLLPLGAVIAGLVASQFDVRLAIWIGVLGGLVVPAVLWLSPLRRLRFMPDPG